jgi:hypothetical protein
MMNSKMTGKRAQSAMEYLMTYGWAILIIAVVLGALYVLGVFSGTTFLGTSCVAGAGYQCTNLLLHNNALTFTFGQATGNTWGNVILYAVPSGTTFSTSDANTVTTATLVSGGTMSANIPETVTTGSSWSGYIYAVYSQGSVSGLQAQVATVTAKAT